MAVAQGTMLLLVMAVALLQAGRCMAENLPVTCGSSIKLLHVLTKFRLHSHEVAYSRGSQQQSVTAFPSGDDGNSYWLVQGPPEAPCKPGGVFRRNARVRLQHVPTRKWLHSHLFTSPLSGNQEVSAFGGDGQTDTGDVWVLEWDGKGKTWKQDIKIRFRHVDTDRYLHSHDLKYGQPIGGQQEVCAVAHRDGNSNWQAAEGVYLPVASAKKAVAAPAAEPTPDEF